jgi:hypothetical protein
VGQPLHCAFIWLKNGQWYLDNDVSGWGSSTTHTGIQYTWKRQASFFPMMNEAQSNPDAYRLSEKMRILAESFSDSNNKFLILEDATTVCPKNYDLWQDMRNAISEETVNEDTLKTAMSPTLLEYEKKVREVKNIAPRKTVTASSNQDATSTITDGGGQWRSKDKESWVEIDLGGPCKINELRIHWWGNSYSNDYDLLAKVDGEFVIVRTEEDEKRSGEYTNPWGVVQGWKEVTSMIRLVMRDGNLDHWYRKFYFGIRQIVITGREFGRMDIITLNKEVKTNLPGTGRELVDGDLKTHWTSDAPSSLIRINLKGLCVMDNVKLDWLNGSIQGRQRIEYLVGGKLRTLATGKFSFIKMKGIAGVLLIKLEDSPSYSIREVTGTGLCYTVQDILKMKLLLGFKQPLEPYNKYVIGDISNIIEHFECVSCN